MLSLVEHFEGRGSKGSAFGVSAKIFCTDAIECSNLQVHAGGSIPRAPPAANCCTDTHNVARDSITAWDGAS